MLIRILEINLARAVEMFRRFTWKFYEINQDEELITVEVRKGDETLRVILPLEDDTVNRLDAEGFIQETRAYR